MALPEANLLSESVVIFGVPLTLNATGFEPGQEFLVLIASDPQVVAMATAGVDGALISSFEVPDDLVPGRHSVVLWPMSGVGGVRQTITVQGASLVSEVVPNLTPVVLPATGRNPWLPIAVGIALLLLGARMVRTREMNFPRYTK
jgi:LPXTG-motif cell wall-anchored protein